MVLLPDEIAGNCLADARHVHAATEQHAGFRFALEVVANRYLGFYEGLDNLPHMAPEIGAHRQLEGVMTMRRHGEPLVGVPFGQLDAVDMDVVCLLYTSRCV